LSNQKRATPAPNATFTPYAPAWPNLAALGFLCLWIAILSLPMWTGQYLAGPLSDQFSTGWAVRHWGAEQWRATSHLPLWNPEMLGGVPVVAGFGDLFYPTAWFRLLLPTTIAIDLAFVLHYVLAGYLAYTFLRMLGVSWLGSVVGGTAYQLSGVVISYASPGHDGKLFVTALFPLILIGLVLGIRRRRFEGYALVGLAVGLALLSPQYQTTQYALIGAGLFALYLALGEPEGLTVAERWRGLGFAVLAVALGFGVSLIQLLPFFHYIPFSPRAGIKGWEWATSYATPWVHVPEFFLSGFTGSTPDGTYWGPNGLKLHSEYLGLPIIGLAALGMRSTRRRLVLWIGAIGLLFLLVALGDGTPFYRLWWSLVPYVNKTRAPGIAFYQVGFATAVLAAFGAERLERGTGKTWTTVGLVTGGLVALLALIGTFGSVATSFAQTHQDQLRQPLVEMAAAAQSSIMWGAVGSGLALAITAGLALLFLRGNVNARGFAILLVLVVGADLWRAGRGFWRWSCPETPVAAASTKCRIGGQVAEDDLIRLVRKTPLPYRVYDPRAVYERDALMAYGIPQVTGYHGNALQSYNELIGGESQQENLRRSLNLWNLLDVRYFIYPDTIHLPGFHQVLGPVRTGAGQQAYLYEADSAAPYARVVPAAVQGDTGEIVPTLLDPRIDYSRIVLFDRYEAVNPQPLVGDHLPPPSPSRSVVAHWAPGRMTIELQPPPPTDSYVLVAENWYPDWHATVDGAPTQVLRGNRSLITVPVKAGSQRVELEFAPHDYAVGRSVTWISLVLLAAWGGGALAWRRRRGARSA